MSFFPFDLKNADRDSGYAGSVQNVDTRKVVLDVPDDSLERISVGKLATLPVGSPLDEWLIGFVERIVCKVQYANVMNESAQQKADDGAPDGGLQGGFTQGNAVMVTLVGTVKRITNDQDQVVYAFTRSLMNVPDVKAPCFVLREKSLETFMNLLVKVGDKEHALAFGHYALDPSATAYLDGDKFFQRHAALLGSTGSGKSWTVATILERAARLPSANLIVFDLHGEYAQLSYARQLRVPGPDDLGLAQADLLYLPYWLMNAEELVAMFVDRSEFTAHNQTLVFQREVEQQKRAFLEQSKKTEVLNAFTVDSPVPFPLDTVLATINSLNSEMVQGARGLKQGDFYGQFSRMLVRIGTKLNDKRYGFLFQAPPTLHTYDAFHTLAKQLLDFSSERSRVKVIDFSEVPADALPIMLGIVARLIYYLQFWMPKDKRHPVALICDEAHIYLPRGGGDPTEERAIASFEKVAKEGRKYGVSIVVVSQRPSDVNATILSQCNNVISLRLTNSADQEVVKRLMPESLSSLLEMLPILDIGEALVVGDAVLLPSRIRVTPPTEKPISATIDFWTEWSKVDMKPDWPLAAENMRRQRRRLS
jgi:hypothetical protein